MRILANCYYGHLYIAEIVVQLLVVPVFSNYIVAHCLPRRLVAFGSAFLLLLNLNILPALAMEASNHFSPHDNTFISKYLKKNEYISLAEIKPGMEGYGLSVFQGTKVERFQVKVIGVIKKVLNGRDAILVRCSGAALGKNNVVRGMSGSPIYIDGRLAGALSYGFDFSKEPIVGITPVADMLEVLSFDDRPGATDRKTSFRSFRDYSRDSSGDSSTSSGAVALPTSSGAGSSFNSVFGSGSASHLVPLMAPVSLAGYSPRAQEFLKDKFKDVGLSISSGVSGALDPTLSNLNTLNASAAKTVKPSGKGESKLEAKLEVKRESKSESSIAATVAAAEAGTVKLVPGGAVAVMLSTGDFSSSATGTATCIFGNKVIAFGHAFMDAGQVAFPMATAYVHDILPSLSVSFKLSSPLQVIGTIFADRPWSIGGEIGRYSELIPLTVTVTDQNRHVKKTYHCRLVDHPELTPSLVTATLMSALDSTYQSEVPNVVKLASSIEIKGHGKLVRTDRFAANFPAHMTGDALSRMRGSVSDPVSGYVGTLVDKLMGNDFEAAAITSMTVDVVVENGRQVAKIDRISVDKPVVAPGETVNVNVVMKPFNRPVYVEKLSFGIPRDLPDGDIAIGISGGDEFDALRKRLGIVDPPSETLKQAINRVSRRERGDTLCGVMALPTQSISFAGDVLRNPPAHWIKLFFSDRSTKVPALVKGEERARVLLEDLVDGSHIIAVTVKRADKIFAKSSPYMVSPSRVANPSDGIVITDQAKKAIDAGRKSDSSSTSSTAGSSSSGASAVAATTSTSSSSSKDTTAPAWSQAYAFPHMRAISLWRQDSEPDFHNGKSEGIAIDSVGRLTPGYRELSRFSLEQEQRIWASVFSRGKFYFAAGNKLLSTNGDAPSVVASLPGMMITSLAADNKGNLYAANAPGGEVFAIDAAGSVKPYVKVSESIVSAMACDLSGHLFIGTSGSGKVYRVDNGAPTLVFDSNQAHVTALNFSERENKLYVGTAEKGCVYSLDANLQVKAEFETGEHIVTGIARDKAGNLFVTTAGAGKLFRVQANGQAEPVAISDAFYTLYYDSHDDRVYSGDAEGDITRVEIDPATDQAQFIPVCHTEQEAVMALCSDGSKLFSGSSNVAQVRTFEIQPSGDPTYSSIVQDAQRPANWSRVRLANVKGESSNNLQKTVRVATRGGETSQPDGSWSAWIDATPDSSADGYLIKSGPSRFLQYKLTWKLGAEKKGVDDLIVSRVDVTYQPTNVAPTIASISVKADDAFSGTVPIVVSGSDLDQDNMLMALELSDDGGKSWKPIVSDQRSRESESEKAKKKEKAKEAAKEVVKESAKESSKEAEKKSVKEPAKDPGKDSGKDPSKQPGASEKKPDAKPDLKKIDPNKSEPKEEQKREEPRKEEPKKEESGKSKTGGDDKKGERKLEDRPSSSDSDSSASADDSSSAAATSSASAAAAKPALKERDKDKDKEKESDSAKSAEAYSATEKFTYSFETKKIKDGQYLMRVTLSDKPSNPGQEKTAVALRSVAIDNTSPKISDLKITRNGAGLSIRLTAHDNLSCISDSTYKIDGSDGFALGSSSGALSDSLTATLAADNVTPAKGAKKITIQVFDRAGNSTKTTENLP
jgi:hypothetical protein